MAVGLEDLAERYLQGRFSLRWAVELHHQNVLHHAGTDHHTLWWNRGDPITVGSVVGHFTLDAGDALLLPPMPTRSEAPTREVPPGGCRMAGCGFTHVMPVPLPGPLQLLALPARWRPSDPIWASLFNRLRFERRGATSAIANQALATGLGQALVWLAIQDLAPQALAAGEPLWLSAVRAELQRFHDPPSLAEVAQQVGVSVPHLVRTFTRVHGCSPMAWSRRQRLDEAARHLVDQPERSIRDIALRCGYRNLKSFTQAFRTRHGHCPRTWRRLGRGGC